MADHPFIHGTRTGTACGTLLVILSSIRFADMIQTAILAATGAVVSFLVSLIMKQVVKRWKKKK